MVMTMTVADVQSTSGITAVIVEGRSQADVARALGVSKGWVSKLLARYLSDGDAAFELRSRRPKTTPTATAAATIELIIELRRHLTAQGLDAGSETIAWHLQHRHHTAVSVSTIARTLRPTPPDGSRAATRRRRFRARDQRRRS